MAARIVRRWTLLMVVAGLSAGVCASLAEAKTTATPLTVCKHGCAYTTIQAAVNHSGRKATIDVKPGKYVEGVVVQGHKHDGLQIVGTGKNPSAVLLEGKNARVQGNAAQNGVEGDNVNNLVLKNMKAEHYAANGFFINNCHGFLMKDLVAAFNRSYGLFVFKCEGGRMTQSVGYGHGDSAFYVGGTPFQKHPATTTLDHDIGYKNVLGFSGSNAKYMVIRDNEFYNNGAGVVPNTWQPEPFEPSSNGVIEDNLIYWNNFDYFRPGSPVKTVSHGVGPTSATFPIGAGVMLFGVSDWTVRDNSIFGNFLWGVAAFSDPTNSTGKALSMDNTIIGNKMGAPFNDPNGADFFNDGSGKGTCFEGNSAGATFDTSATDPDLYPTCPNSVGSGTINGDSTQFQKLAAIVLANPPTGQEKFWHVHSHPARKDRTPFEG